MIKIGRMTFIVHTGIFNPRFRKNDFSQIHVFDFKIEEFWNCYSSIHFLIKLASLEAEKNIVYLSNVKWISKMVKMNSTYWRKFVQCSWTSMRRAKSCSKRDAINTNYLIVHNEMKLFQIYYILHIQFFIYFDYHWIVNKRVHGQGFRNRCGPLKKHVFPAETVIRMYREVCF